jgi:hypothetical protein
MKKASLKAGIFILALLSLALVIFHFHSFSEIRTFPEGTATPSAVCGGCHQELYREYAFGFGTDLTYKPMAYKSPLEGLLSLPGRVLNWSAHSISATDPWPIHARGVEEEGKSCNVCHFPEAFDLPDLDQVEIAKPKGRPKGKEAEGITCASCHITPDGKMRGPYAALSVHETVEDPKMKTSVMCAYCHSMGKRIPGKQTQTFLEWREDFHKPGLGPQECQDCHMPRTMRKLAEEYNVPVRAVARHLWTGGHSTQRISSALTLALVAEGGSSSKLRFHLINVGAGHSVPTGSNRRAIFLKANVVDAKGNIVAKRDWMFAPWYGNRPDDKAFLEEDKKRPDAVSAIQADKQGPHEDIIRAGEERVMAWDPKLPQGSYEVRASLVYKLNRYNENFEGDETTIFQRTLPFMVQ